MPCFILQAAIIAYLCKMSMGATLLPPAFGFKDVHQPCGGGERVELRLHLSRELHQCLMVHRHELVYLQPHGVGSESSYGSISLVLMASVPPPTVIVGPAAEDATQEVV
jgi:hypothetical protein